MSEFFVAKIAMHSSFFAFADRDESKLNRQVIEMLDYFVGHDYEVHAGRVNCDSLEDALALIRVERVDWL